MKKNNIKSIVLTAVAVILIGIGYINFNVSDNSLDMAYTNNSEKSGDVQLVSSNSLDTNFESAIVSNEETEEQSNNVVNTNSSNPENNTDYFTESRLQRDTMYSQSLSTYQKMWESKEVSAEQKSIAMQEIEELTNQKNGILISENLIKNKGFSDVVIFFNKDSVSVIVKSNISLTPEQIAQIQNIVSRELAVSVEKINISNK